ncbi:MAG: hypothetical protein U0T78_03915 [Cloacibacterium normanense]
MMSQNLSYLTGNEQFEMNVHLEETEIRLLDRRRMTKNELAMV